MSGYEGSAWTDFALGHLGASAALVGLVFVGLSINIQSVIRSEALVHRAGEAILLLGVVLATSTLLLIPGQEKDVLAAELILVGAAILIFVAALQRRGDDRQPHGSVVLRRVSALGGPALVALAGISLMLGEGGGLYWWPPAIVLAYIGALGSAWVLLVEILR
jgi:modulator of FtsH protease